MTPAPPLTIRLMAASPVLTMLVSFASTGITELSGSNAMDAKAGPTSSVQVSRMSKKPTLPLRTDAQAVEQAEFRDQAWRPFPDVLPRVLTSSLPFPLVETGVRANDRTHRLFHIFSFMTVDLHKGALRIWSLPLNLCFLFYLCERQSDALPHALPPPPPPPPSRSQPEILTLDLTFCQLGECS